MKREYTDAEEKAFFKAYAEGDEKSLRILHKIYHPVLTALLKQRTNWSRDDREDFIQDVFIRIDKNKSRYDVNNKAQLTTWIHTIALRMLYNVFRTPKPICCSIEDLPDYVSDGHTSEFILGDDFSALTVQPSVSLVHHFMTPHIKSLPNYLRISCQNMIDLKSPESEARAHKVTERYVQKNRLEARRIVESKIQSKAWIYNSAHMPMELILKQIEKADAK